MLKGLFADSPPFTQIIMLAFTMIVCFLLFMFIGILFAPLLFGVSISELMSIISGTDSTQSLNIQRYIQVLYSLGFFVIPAFFVAYLFSRFPIRYLCLDNRRQTVDSRHQTEDIRYSEPETQNSKLETRNLKWFIATLILMLAAMPCINMLVAFNEMIVFPESLSGLEQRLKDSEEVARKMTKLFLNVDNIGGLFFNIFMIAVLPALGEELIFRGVIQKILIRWTGSIHAGIIVGGLLFSMMHMQFYGFFPRWLLGIMFGYLLIWSGTMWLPVFAHFVNNAVAVLFSFLIYKGVISESIEKFGSNWHDIPVTVLAAAICAFLLWKMYRSSKNVF